MKLQKRVSKSIVSDTETIILADVTDEGIPIDPVARGVDFNGFRPILLGVSDSVEVSYNVCNVSASGLFKV